MKNLLLTIVCLVTLSTLPACKYLSCDKNSANKPASQTPSQS